MVDRQEVEALVREIEEGCREHSCTPHDMSLDVEGDTLLALCRAWLAVQDAPVGVVDIRSGWDDGSGAIEVHYEEGRPDIPLKQRVRIVKEAGEVAPCRRASPTCGSSPGRCA